MEVKALQDAAKTHTIELIKWAWSELSVESFGDELDPELRFAIVQFMVERVDSITVESFYSDDNLEAEAERIRRNGIHG